MKTIKAQPPERKTCICKLCGVLTNNRYNLYTIQRGGGGYNLRGGHKKGIPLNKFPSSGSFKFPIFKFWELISSEIPK